MDCSTDSYIPFRLVMSVEVRPSGVVTQCEILHTLDAVVGELLGSIVGDKLGSNDTVPTVGRVDG